jgi:hypothetical protein
MHMAIETHAGSFGQVVPPEQQFVATHAMHDMDDAFDAVDAAKICEAPGHVVDASPVAAVPASTMGRPPSPGAPGPPPCTAPTHGVPFVDMHPASCGGLGLLEHAGPSATIATAAAAAESA